MRAALLLVAAAVAVVRADFVFLDFNSTQTLSIRGAATTSTCADAVDALEVPGAALGTEDHPDYQPAHGAADFVDSEEPEMLSEKVHVEHETIATADLAEAETIAEHLAGAGHRDSYVASPKVRCPGRVRLTPSAPHQRGAVWARRRMFVLNGFETSFAFQMSDPSRACTEVKDPAFGLHHHTSCVVHGGDGFSFVLHAHSNGTDTLGRRGREGGFGGITNSLAIEFDTWFNAENSSADLFQDHVAVHSNGVGTNHAGLATLLAGPKPHSLADGLVHTATVRYHDYINDELVPYFTAQPALAQYMLDGSEGRRLGSMSVHLDGAAEPLLAFPINLAAVLDLPQSAAYVGFASSTGRSWEKHDLLAWYFCEETPCLDPDATREFDYHVRSRGWDTAYAGTVVDHQYADTSPQQADMVHLAGDRNEGVNP